MSNYSMEKALHETLNVATENLKQAVEQKESLKLSPNHSEPTAMKSTARSNVANKRQRSINIIKAMQNKASTKFKTEHWQKVHHELMDSSIDRFTEIEIGNDIYIYTYIMSV